MNQFPDADADRSIGRSHYPILIGRKATSLIYGALLLITYLLVIAGIQLHLLPVFSGLALVTSFLAWRAYQGSRRNADNLPALIASMGMNVILNLATPVLLGIGLMLSGGVFHAHRLHRHRHPTPGPPGLLRLSSQHQPQHRPDCQAGHAL